jgi:hypothetical protein
MKIFQLAEECICCGCSEIASSPAVLMPFVAKRVFGHDPLEIKADWGFRDLKPGLAHTLCHSLQCQECGALFLDYRFTDKQMAALYHNYMDEAYTRQRDHYEPGYAATTAQHYTFRQSYIADVEAWLAPRLPLQPAVLDWGGGSGMNAPFLGRSRLLHVHDISNVEVVAGADRISSEVLGGEAYDLVVCNQVLEHVPFPDRLIDLIRPALGAETLLYLGVPHEALMRAHPGSLDLATLKRHWHEHINFYTEPSMRRLLERVGLEVVDVHYVPTLKGVVLGMLAKLP